MANQNSPKKRNLLGESNGYNKILHCADKKMKGFLDRLLTKEEKSSFLISAQCQNDIFKGPFSRMVCEYHQNIKLAFWKIGRDM